MPPKFVDKLGKPWEEGEKYILILCKGGCWDGKGRPKACEPIIYDNLCYSVHPAYWYDGELRRERVKELRNSTGRKMQHIVRDDLHPSERRGFAMATGVDCRQRTERNKVVQMQGLTLDRNVRLSHEQQAKMRAKKLSKLYRDSLHKSRKDFQRGTIPKDVVKAHEEGMKR